MTPSRARVPATAPPSSSSSLIPAVTTSARDAVTGPSGPAILRGILGSVLLTVGGFGAGAVPVDGGPATTVGLLGFTFGHGQVLALILCWIGVALLTTSWLALGPRAVSGHLPTRDAVWATALWSVPLLPSVPLFSGDAWSYLAQGAMTGAGISAYEYGPAANPGPFTDQVHPDWLSTTTPYGPLHLMVMRGLVALSGGHPAVGILLLRVLVVAALATLVVLLIRLARRTGVDPGVAVWMACASPLTVVHLVGGLHNEIFPLLACVAAVLLAVRRRVAAAGAMIALAVAFKATAVILAPFLLWIVLDQHRADTAVSRPSLRAARDTAVAMVTSAAVFAVVTIASGTGTGWLDAMSVSDKVINYLSIPTAVAHFVHMVSEWGLEDILAVTRTVGQVLLVCILVAVWVLHRRSTHTALRGITLAFLAFLLLNTLAWPWYYVWVAAFWVFAGMGRRSTTAAVAVTVFLIAVIGPNGSTSLYSPALAGAALLAAVVAALWWHRKTGESQNAKA